jgi:hypothetical protein
VPDLQIGVARVGIIGLDTSRIGRPRRICDRHVCYGDASYYECRSAV